MDFAKVLTKQVLLKVGKVVWDEVVVPLAQEYVAETSNPYDDAVLAFVKDFAEQKLFVELMK